jgi:hypothetical protein
MTTYTGQDSNAQSLMDPNGTGIVASEADAQTVPAIHAPTGRNGHANQPLTFTGKKRIRKSFGRIPEAVQMPNLIEVQRSSYEQFLQRETRAADRRDEGIEAVFKSVFPIRDFNERSVSSTSPTSSRSPSTTSRSASSAT